MHGEQSSICEEEAAVNPAPVAETPHTLESLREIGLASSGKALLALYQLSRAPASLMQLSGDPYSLGLVVHVESKWGFPALLAPLINYWIQRPSFPWHGKSFRATSDAKGTGFNRLRLGNTTRHPFKTSIGPSFIDRQPCVQIDYDIEGNRWFERPLYDELREISPGVFFGPVSRRGEKVLCWFGVDVNQQVEFRIQE